MHARLNIAIIAPGFSKDADDWAIPALQSLATGLARKHEVRFFSLRYPATGRYTLGNLSHIAVGGGRSFGFSSIGVWKNAVRAIVREHAIRPFHLLHAFWADEPGLVAVLAGLRLRLPVIVSLGGGELTYLSDIDYGTQGSAVRRPIMRLSLGRAGLVSAGSEHQARLARERGVSQAKLRVVPFGVDTAIFALAPSPEWSRPTLVQAASLTAVKDQHLLLRVLARVKSSRPNIRLLLAGDGPQRQTLLGLAERLALIDDIEFRDKVDHPDMPAFYAAGHLYVQTSRHESQGMSVLEAMACGLPTVGTPVGVLPEIACRPPTWSEEQLAAQIIDILAHKQPYARLRGQARATVESGYSLVGTLERFQSLYRKLLRDG